MTILETARLRAREIREEDLNDIFDLQSDPVSMQYIRAPINDPAIVRERMQSWANYRAAHPKFGVFALEYLENGLFAGYCVARHANFDVSQDHEIGYVIHPDFQGKGLATEIAGGLTEYLFRVVPNLEKVVAFTDPLNIASQRVLEKCGFVRTGLVHIYDGESFLFERYP